MEELLKVNDISMVFGGLRAVSNFSMTINKGELIGLIGPNGAGKTTAFNMITGVYTPTEGEIILTASVPAAKILSGNAVGHGAYFPEYPPVFRAFCYRQRKSCL